MSSPIPFKNQERQDLDVDLECWTLCPRRFPSSVPSTVMAGLNKHRSFAEEAAFVSSVKPAAKKWGIWTIHDDLQLGKGLLTSSPYQLKRSRYVADVFTTCFWCPQVAKKNCYRLKKKKCCIFWSICSWWTAASSYTESYFHSTVTTHVCNVCGQTGQGRSNSHKSQGQWLRHVKKKKKKERKESHYELSLPQCPVLSLLCLFSPSLSLRHVYISYRRKQRDNKTHFY